MVQTTELCHTAEHKADDLGREFSACKQLEAVLRFVNLISTSFKVAKKVIFLD